MERILIHCVEYIDIRHLYLNVNTVRELFDTVPPVLIISFIRRAGLHFHKFIVHYFIKKPHLGFKSHFSKML